MFTLKRLLVIVLLLLGSKETRSDDIPSVVILAAADWCPYSCILNESGSGIVHEYIALLLEQENIELDIKVVPWSRAIYDASEGRVVHGLLTAVQEEAPELLFTSIPIMSYEVCFFTNQESQWSFSGEDSLKEIRLGAIQDYSYGAQVDPYIRNSANSASVVLIKGSDGILRLLSMLKSGRFDVFLDDSSVVGWEAAKNNIDESGLRNAGCLTSTPFYLAVNPDLPWARKFVALLDALFSKTENREILQQIHKKYTLGERDQRSR